MLIGAVLMDAGKETLCIQSIALFDINHLTLELNPSAQRCLTRFLTGDFAS
jgi:hypothetical protein